MKLHVVYMVGDATMIDEVDGNCISTQMHETGHTLVTFAGDDGQVRRLGAAGPELERVRAIHYAEAARIVKTME